MSSKLSGSRQDAQDRRRVLTSVTVGPLSRVVDVMNVPPRGLEIRVEATAEERAALAKDFRLERIDGLSGEYRLTASAKGVHVVGRVQASILQVCVVSLDTFASEIDEQVEVDFGGTGAMPAELPIAMHEYEPPDEILDGQVDLGALTAEFLALGLDPYPRKPGVDFAFPNDNTPDSPLAALAELKRE